MAKNKPKSGPTPPSTPALTDEPVATTEAPELAPLETLTPVEPPAMQTVTLRADNQPAGLLVRRTHPAAQVPVRSTEGAAGLDLFAAVDGTVPTRGRTLVTTGIEVAIPSGFVGLIWPRSGLAVKRGIETGAGVIDADYRGEVGVLLHNHTDSPYEYKAGDRVAQLVLMPIAEMPIHETNELPPTTRAKRGYGSTGA